jgi:cephalosporin-C deacetylase-like acetyl esterase
MKNKKNFFLAVLATVLLSINFSVGQITITPERTNGTYEVGETALWAIDFDAETPIDSVFFKLKKGGLTVIQKGVLYPKGKKLSVSHLFNVPGAVLLDIRWKDENNEEQKIVGGAIASPDRIELSADKPDDFDSFWESQIKTLQQIPKNIKLSKEPSGVAGVKYYKTTLNNINGSKIRGQLARPIKGKKLPALLIVQWAGVYPLQKAWAIDKAQKGWLVLNINAHDLPIDKEASFYKNQANGPLNNYPGIGNEDKSTSYFLRMYLSCYRAAQYLTERKDWNGETLVVMGTSQGGLQSLMTAGLHSKITASLALVPAGFDMFGPEVGREPGWPKWYSNIETKDAQKVRETSRYFDVANFIPNITCPVLVGVGLLDQTCPPEGIYAGLNQLTARNEIMLLPKSEHQDTDGSQQPYNERAEEDWLPSLLKGEQLPRK